MRIVGGAFSGRRLASVGGGAPEAHLRPTPDRVREALFNLLEHGDYPPIEGGRALDLFAGTGALGLEALSRGAERAQFVEEHPTARALIRQNIETLGVIGRSKLFRRDATRLGPWRGAAPFSHVFLDPPYRKDLGPKALASAREGGWLADGAVAVLEIAGDEEAPEIAGFKRCDLRRYGDTQILVMVRSGS
ncbi:MAG: 16S rRNA (guanine(966)-N(2))-methyltransferase RsmD [Pseudomonadota bacterium]